MAKRKEEITKSKIKVEKYLFENTKCYIDQSKVQTTACSWQIRNRPQEDKIYSEREVRENLSAKIEFRCNRQAAVPFQNTRSGKPN